MKLSDLQRINRDAESGQLSADLYANHHAAAAAEARDGRLEMDRDEVHAWLIDQAKDLDAEKIEFFASQDEQKAVFEDRIKAIAEHHDKLTFDRLEQLAEDSRQQKAEAISSYVQEQRNALANAIREREIAQKEYQQNHAELQELAKQHKSLSENHMEIQSQIDEKTLIVKQMKPQSIQSAARIVNHYKESDNFNFSASPTISAASYALYRDRNFQDKLETMSDVSRTARDPDVRERIEIEMERQKATYTIEQNYKIQDLSQENRYSRITELSATEKAAAIRAVELDFKLESKGIKVDFSFGDAPDVRAIQDNEKLSQDIQKDLQQVRCHQFQTASLESKEAMSEASVTELNQSGHALNAKATEVENSRDKFESASAKLAARINANRERARESNAGFKAPVQVSSMQAEARQTQQLVQESTKQQQNPELGHGLS